MEIQLLGSVVVFATTIFASRMGVQSGAAVIVIVQSGIFAKASQQLIRVAAQLELDFNSMFTTKSEQLGLCYVKLFNKIQVVVAVEFFPEAMYQFPGSLSIPVRFIIIPQAGTTLPQTSIKSQSSWVWNFALGQHVNFLQDGLSIVDSSSLFLEEFYIIDALDLNDLE
ncbi:hypothetical protein EDD18DRAFT_1470066 [Armillaria luteobubalina]|uniref:Uncharacterized protein n=1 Tax=Armillaria luteobubalina TaxID=153913 RepID=A0AA39P1Q6_9AGAR|nr:hypothetical protein EDD18DRAFT_1470066 [Armillaria luteobubalina]